jgi:hypothetical protein
MPILPAFAEMLAIEANNSRQADVTPAFTRGLTLQSISSERTEWEHSHLSVITARLKVMARKQLWKPFP